jgi:hypothetical protein
LRIEAAGGHAGVDLPPPQFDGRFIRHQFALTGIGDERPAKFAFDLQIPEGIPAGEMEEIRNRAQDLALRAFAGAGRSKEEKRAIHAKNGRRPAAQARSLCFIWIS